MPVDFADDAIWANLVTGGAALISAWYAWRANRIAQDARQDEAEANRIAAESNGIAGSANDLSESANQIAQKALALQSASLYFQPIDECVRLIQSLKVRDTPFQLSGEDCRMNLSALDLLRAEFGVLEGAAQKIPSAIESVRAEMDLVREVTKYIEFVGEAGFDLTNYLDTLLQQTHLGYGSALRAMTNHLKILRTAFGEGKDSGAWKAVDEDRNFLHQELREFGGDFKKLTNPGS